MADYYASPSGTAGGAGTLGDPFDLQTMLDYQPSTNHNLWMRGGTYTGKFLSARTAGTLRSYCYQLYGYYSADEWAILDGGGSTTLSEVVDHIPTGFDVGSTAGMRVGAFILINDEEMMVTNVVDSNSITVNRSQNGHVYTTPHQIGDPVYLSAPTLSVLEGDNTVYRDFEVTNTLAFRDEAANLAAITRGGLTVTGSADGNKFVNLILHDMHGPLFTGSATLNTEIYGCISYNNGDATSSSPGDGYFYLINNISGYSKFYHNIALTGLNGNIQTKGDGANYLGGDHQRNIVANPVNFFNYHARSDAGGSINMDGNHLYCTDAYNSHNLQLVLDALTLNDNYIVGGIFSVSMSDIGSITGSGNHIFREAAPSGGVAELEYNAEILNTTGTFNNNTWHNASGRNDWSGPGGRLTLAEWRTYSGFDATSTATSAVMPDSYDVIPNAYETGRAHIAIHTPSNATSIDVDLTDTGLAHGQAYTIKNAYNLSGSNVLTGTFDSGNPTVSVPLDGAAATVVQPIGASGVWTVASGAPEFYALLVLPGAQATAGGAMIWRRN